jgi:signal transduction histidine kinase
MRLPLYLRIYLTTLLSLLAMVVVTVLLWGLIMQRVMQAEHESLAGIVAARVLPAPGASSDAVMKHLHGYLSEQVAGLELRDRDGALLGSAGTLAGDRPAQAAATHGTLSLHRLVLADGRMLLIELRPGQMHFHLHGLAIVLWIALGVGIATYPLARRLTRRLEALAGTVDRFGGGELAVRAQEQGRDEVSALARSFNQMADRVASLLQAHRRLLANTSHELRSPLARIRMALELHGAAADAPWLEGMRADCAEIDEQIEEILLASKLETLNTQPSAEPLDLAALVAEECTRVKVPFEVVPAPLRGDPRLLRRLLRNLLDNAHKHGGKGVAAHLSIAADGRYLLQISDRGPGIPAADRERVFEPYYRPAGARETGSGWGLGLALVKQIAEHHRGSVLCREREGGGCVFEVRLVKKLRF